MFPVPFFAETPVLAEVSTEFTNGEGKRPSGKDMVTLPILTVTQSFRPVRLAKLSGNGVVLRNFSDFAELAG